MYLQFENLPILESPNPIQRTDLPSSLCPFTHLPLVSYIIYRKGEPSSLLQDFVIYALTGIFLRNLIVCS